MILPKTKVIYEKNQGDLKIVSNVLSCVERTLDRLDKSQIIDEVLPLLYDIRLSDPQITLRVVSEYPIGKLLTPLSLPIYEAFLHHIFPRHTCNTELFLTARLSDLFQRETFLFHFSPEFNLFPRVSQTISDLLLENKWPQAIFLNCFLFADIYRLMLSDKKYGLSVNLMATKVMPSLLPQTVNPSLNLEQFTILLEVLQEMLDHIDRNQRNKLKLDNLSLPSPERHRPLRHQYSSDNMHVPPFNIPNLRIEQRKTSSAEDMARKNSTGEIFSQ